jgi:uncharacterized protein (DUF1697 family)
MQTYGQSGNLVFSSDVPRSQIAPTLAKGIHNTFDVDVPVLVRTKEEPVGTCTSNPFADEGLVPHNQPTLFHVTFLDGIPDPGRVDGIADLAVRYDPDTFRVVGSDIFLSIPGGYGETKLTNALFEKRLGVPATTRNWKSVVALTQMVNE